MKAGRALRFAVLSGAIAIAAGLALLPLGLQRGPTALFWGGIGWAIMALTGVAGGTWLVRAHGRQGSGFLVALGTCMLARLFASVAGALTAASSGMDAVWPYIAGLGAGYVPLQLFEVGWFLRVARSRSRETAPLVSQRPVDEIGNGR
jgi:hypothetical protein